MAPHLSEPQSRPSITVAMPIYNGERYVKEAVASILAQAVDFELIVSDDASRDRSVAIVEAFADPRIRVLRNDVNVGIFGNLNFCIEAARGDLIQVFSQDDVMMEGYLASQAALLTKHPDAGLVYGGAVSIDAAGRVVGDAEQDATPERIDRPLYVWLSSHWGALPADLIDHGAASNLRDDRPLRS
jgi:glycosyltransferase involved in cell wall biosynthesis